MADLNGDSLPDLYDVTYLSAQAAATQICRRGAEVHWCSPDAFEAEQDQVYWNLARIIHHTPVHVMDISFIRRELFALQDSP